MRTSIVFVTGAALAALVLTFGSRADDKPPARTDPKDGAGAKLDPKDMPGASSVTEIEGKTLKQWIEETRNEDPSVREKAIRAVMLFGPQATIAVPALVERCVDVEASPRVRAVIALTFIDIQDKDRGKVIEALAKRLEVDAQGKFEDPQGIVRYHAALALNRFTHEEAKSAIPQLVNATRDWSSFETRRAAITALRTIARDPKTGPDARATHALIATLGTSPAGIPNEKAGDVKLEAIIALAAMGRPTDAKLLTEIETTLKAYLNSRDNRLAIWAHYSQLALLEPTDKAFDSHLDAIAKYATNPDVVTRTHTATALGQVGPKAKSHVGFIVKMLQDKDNEVFVAACTALANIGEPGRDAIEKLKAIAEAKDDAEPKVDPGRKLVAKSALDAIENYGKTKEKTDVKKDDTKDDKKDNKKDK
jgi:HEAT repeat protein